MILGLAAVFLAASPPLWVLGAGAGAGAAVAAVAVHAGLSLAPASWGRASSHRRWIVYGLAGGVAAATVGPWLVLVLLACGALELVFRRLDGRQPPVLQAGPVLVIAAVGSAAAGHGGGVLAAAVAFAPSYAFVLLGARHFDAVRRSPKARALLDGAGPAAIGAILGVAVPLALALGQPWQLAVLAGATLCLFALRRSVVTTLLLAGAVGVIAVELGASLP